MVNKKLQMLKGDKLFNNLLNSPVFFSKKGLGNELLNEYFDGYPIETLKSLLVHDDDLIKREAVFILSELGEETCNHFLDTIIPLLKSEDKAIQYFTMQSIFLGSFTSRHKDFSHVIRMTKSSSDSIRNYALELIEKANIEQLRSSLLVMVQNS